MGPPPIQPTHLARRAAIYVRQSTDRQVERHTGSTAYQRGLKEHLLRWGWPEDQIDLIEDDLGKSGASGEHRAGWQRLLRGVANAVYGMVIAFDPSRLSRSRADFESLLGLCCANDCLLAFDGAIVDPNNPDDRFMAGIRAEFSQLEKEHNVRRSMKSRRAKAEKGHVVSRPPIGLIAVREGNEITWLLDPEPRVRQRIADALQQYETLGSVRKVLRWFIAHRLEVPSRRGGKLRWRRPSVGWISGVLKQVAYCGVYRFGCTSRRQPGSRGKPHPLPREQWIEKPGHHPGYITPAAWHRIQARLRRNRVRDYNQPIGRGPALCQARVACGRCGRKMFTYYRTVRGRGRVKRTYRCEAAMAMYGEPSCWSVDGETLDTLVAVEVLRSLGPPEVEAVLEAGGDGNAGYEAVCRQRAAELERARARVRILKEHVEGIHPEHRLAAAELHKDLEEALAEVKRIEHCHREAPISPPLELTPEDVEEIRQLAADLPALWADPATTAQDRKRLVGFLVEEIRVVAVSPTSWEVDLAWRSGAVTHHPLIRWWAGRFRARELRAQGLGWAEIAEQLNREGFRTRNARGLFTPRTARMLLYGAIYRARAQEKRAGTSAGGSPAPGSTGHADGDGASGGSAGPPEARPPVGAVSPEGNAR